jgi:hypothetical protein
MHDLVQQNDSRDQRRNGIKDCNRMSCTIRVLVTVTCAGSFTTVEFIRDDTRAAVSPNTSSRAFFEFEKAQGGSRDGGPD